MEPSRELRRRFLRLLRNLGYGCRSRRAGWVEVLLWRADERWQGQGIDRAAALDDALARMFPSQAAHHALCAAHVAAESASDAHAAAPVAEEPLLLPPTPESVAAPALAVVPYRQPPPGPSASELDGLHEELGELTTTLESLFVDVLDWSPERQRLIVLAWVAQARDIQDRAHHDPTIERRVSGLCSRLVRLTKIGWPGNVAALGLHATVGECLADLGAVAAGPVPSWSTVVDAAEAQLEELDRKALACGIDEQGWADADRLLPAPPDPRSLSNAVRADLEAWTGPIPDAQAILDGAAFEGEPPRSLLHDLPVDRTRGELLQLARKLRWLRGSDVCGWGEMLGRVRWIADRASRFASSELAAVLDPQQLPRASWARECGFDPEARARKQRRRELFRELNQLVPGDPAALQSWILRAMELGNEMGNDKLAGALRDRAQEVLALPAEGLPERSQRSRLRRLQGILGGGAVPAPAEETEETEPADSESAAPEAEPAPDLPARVLEFTRGKRALIACNRPDPEHDEELQRLLDLERIERCELGPRRVESASERIRSGTYDFVLAATGFMPHKVEHTLRAACRARGIRYIRINRGRPGACVRHIARELGVSS